MAAVLELTCVGRLCTLEELWQAVALKLPVGGAVANKMLLPKSSKFKPGCLEPPYIPRNGFMASAVLALTSIVLRCFCVPVTIYKGASTYKCLS